MSVRWMAATYSGYALASFSVTPLPNVATVGREPPVIEYVPHQLREDVGGPAVIYSSLLRKIGEPVPRYGRDDHVERVGCVAPVTRRIGEHGDDLVEPVERIRPAVGEEQAASDLDPFPARG